MEGSSVPESESLVPKDTKEDQPENQAETPANISLTKRLKTAVNRKKLLAVGGLAGFATLAGVAGFKAAKDGENTETPITPTPAEKTIKPTTEPTQVVEITPTPIQESPTPTPTPEVTPVPETEKPKNYTIEILPPENQAYENYSIEQAKEIVDSTFAKYPPIGNLKVQITLGSGNWYDPENNSIKLDRASYNLNLDLLHELVHNWDWQILNHPELFEGNTQNELIALRTNILQDQQIGRNYPSFDRIFTGDQHEATRKFEAGEKISLEDLRLISSEQADILWIHDESNPLNNFLADTQLDSKRQPIELIEGQPQPTNLIKYETFSQFLQGEATFLDELSQRNPLWQENMQDIRSNTPKYEAVIKKINYDLNYDRQSAQYYEALRIIARVRTAERVLEDDAKIKEVIDTQAYENIKTTLLEKSRSADVEKLSQLIPKYLFATENNQLLQDSQQLSQFVNKIVSGSQ